MTKDQIIAMARESGAAFEPSFESALRNPMWLFSPMDLNRFASLVAAKAAAEEREACAQIVYQNALACDPGSLLQIYLASNAAAIRERK